MMNDLQINNVQTTYDINFQEVKNYLLCQTEKYKNLIVTDYNLADMVKVKGEIVRMRTSLAKTQKAIKVEMAKPYFVIEGQIKQLLEIVAEVERPIVEQLEIYDEKRKDIRRLTLEAIRAVVAVEYGVPEDSIAIIERFYNKTISDDEVLLAMREQGKTLEEKRIAAENAVKVAAQAARLREIAIDAVNAKMALKSPIMPEDLEHLMTDDIERSVLEHAIRRKENEERQAQTVITPVTETKPPEPIAETKKIVRYLFRLTDSQEKKLIQFAISNCIEMTVG